MDEGRRAHLDLLTLEAVRTGEAGPADRAHVDSCPECAAALAELRELALAIERTGRTALPVGAEIDRAVLEAGRKRIARLAPRRAPVRRRRWAAAAALVLFLGLGFWVLRHEAPSLLARRDPFDIDRSGAVDILDAYTLAVRLRSGGALERRWDLNGDGRVDQGDVDLLARASVSLERRGP
jgi:Dockerin type I domain